MALRQVTACTVFELNREWGIEDLGKLTVSEGDGEEDRINMNIQRINMNIQIVRDDCAVLKRCLKVPNPNPCCTLISV